MVLKHAECCRSSIGRRIPPRRYQMRHGLRIVSVLAMLAAVSSPASAQIDLSGEWTGTCYEDLPYRGGVQLGDDDPKYLNQQYLTSTHFKREQDASKWSPSNCE